MKNVYMKNVGRDEKYFSYISIDIFHIYPQRFLTYKKSLSHFFLVVLSYQMVYEVLQKYSRSLLYVTFQVYRSHIICIGFFYWIFDAYTCAPRPHRSHIIYMSLLQVSLHINRSLSHINRSLLLDCWFIHPRSSTTQVVHHTYVPLQVSFHIHRSLLQVSFQVYRSHIIYVSFVFFLSRSLSYFGCRSAYISADVFHKHLQAFHTSLLRVSFHGNRSLLYVSYHIYL